jgi:hypothetical protein
MALILRSCLLLMFLVRVSGQVTIWTDTFAGPGLDPGRWQVTGDGDFREWSVGVADLPAPGGGRLGLSADTRGSRDETIKLLGVRSVPAIALDRDVRISVDLDWNAQANGSYLSAAIVLSPQATSQNPFTVPDGLKVEYVGVPPGKHGRMVVGVRRGGRERTLFNEGWPGRGREGRPIGLQRVAIVYRDGAVQVWENDVLLYDSQEALVDFGAAYLYLQMTSHSNYPRRTVYFDNVRVEDWQRP